MIALTMVAAALVASQDLESAVKKTVEQGFAYTIKPSADLTGFSQAKSALAGASVKGEYAGGVFHAQDGTYEIYREGGRVAVRAERGWLSLDRFAAPMRVDLAEAFDPDDGGRTWKRGNVTKGREALHRLIQLTHLVHRSDIAPLTNLPAVFTGELRTSRRDGADVFEGELSATAAFNLLQGPFDELVRRGTLSFENAGGGGRVTVRDGVVRRVVVKATGRYAYYNEDDNVKKRGACVVEIVAELTKAGETKVEPPKEAAAILKE